MDFGSLEAALTTTADVALQIALAGGLGAEAAWLMADSSGRLYKKPQTQRSQRCINSNVCKRFL
jgi:hypothetical protein